MKKHKQTKEEQIKIIKQLVMNPDIRREVILMIEEEWQRKEGN
jgi:hypothetical protein